MARSEIMLNVRSRPSSVEAFLLVPTLVVEGGIFDKRVSELVCDGLT